VCIVGFWAEKLGVGEFYYELSVQIVEVCMALAHRTGGLMTLDDVRARVIKSRGGKDAQNITKYVTFVTCSQASFFFGVVTCNLSSSPSCLLCLVTTFCGRSRS
jgi:hypothetical protein